MDSRHDSIMEIKDQDTTSGLDSIPSSPLSALPSDFDIMPVPLDLTGLGMFSATEGQVQTATSSQQTLPMFDDAMSEQESTEPLTPGSFIRRSTRKRKTTAKVTQRTMTLSPLSSPGNDSEHESSESSVIKRRRVTRATTKARANASTSTRANNHSQSQASTVHSEAQSQASGVNSEAQSQAFTTLHNAAEAMASDSESVHESTSDFEASQQPSQSSQKSLTIKLKLSPEMFSQLNLNNSVPTASKENPSDNTGFVSISASKPATSTPVMSNMAVDPSIDADADLVNLSLALTHYVPIEEKPLPRGQPEVWAATRWDLCDCLRGIYESRQGGFYGKAGVAKAFLLDGNSHSRDYMDENVIILRAGGCMSKDDAGKMVQNKDQEPGAQFMAVTNAITQQTPVAVISGNNNDLAPSQMPHKYSSLDWYKPTHAWTEYDHATKTGSSGMKIIKFRLEKLDTSVTGWWVPEGASPLVPLGSLGPALKHKCESCDQEFDHVYLSGWMCFNSACDAFWTLPDGNAPCPSTLLYDPRFLKQQVSWINEKPPMGLRLPLHIASPMAGEDYKKENLAGMACPDCGKCNSRVKWSGWDCSGCGFEYKPQINVIPASGIRDQRVPVTDAYPASNDWAAPQVDISVKFSHNYRWISYKFQVSDTEEAEVVHGIANKVVREEQNGPNEMWEHLQTNCDGLTRRRLGNGHMNSFTMNYGMPYKFIAAGESLPFDQAPWPILETVSRLNWANKVSSDSAIGAENNFNELYIVGYMEEEKMKYHDDGEEGLGSMVATLSLGAPAEMLFRPKTNYYHGVKKATRQKKQAYMMTMDNPLPGFPNYEKRKALVEEVSNSNLSKEQKDQRLFECAKELGYASLKASAPAPKEWIKLHLGHGDIVIMRGAQFQRYFEHSVTPKGLMRYALTCRTILPGHLKSSELPNYEVEPDQGNYDGSRIA